MHIRLWLASAATVTIVGAGAIAASPTIYGQAGSAAAKDQDVTTPEDADERAREIGQAVREAVKSAAVQDAVRAAQDVVRDMDVRVLVDDGMQGFPDLANLGGRPRIGVSTRDLTADEAKNAGLTGIAGALVTEVPADSVAGKAGLQADDIIVSVDGETIRSARHLARVIAETPEGRALQIGYVRATTQGRLTVTPEVRPMTLGRGPGQPGKGPTVRRFERRAVPALPGGGERFDMVVPRVPDAREFFYRRGPDGGMRIWSGRARLGVTAQPLTEQLATYFGVKEGVLVTEVRDESAAAKAGIKAGDVVTAVNGKAVTEPGDIVESLDAVEAGKTVTVAITRDRKAQTVSVTLPASSTTSEGRSVPRRRRFTA